MRGVRPARQTTRPPQAASTWSCRAAALPPPQPTFRRALDQRTHSPAVGRVPLVLMVDDDPLQRLLIEEILEPPRVQ
jgi:transposase